MKLFQLIASMVIARTNCAHHTPPNGEWYTRHGQRIDALVKEHMPSGGGFDTGTRFLFAESTRNKLVFSSAYHKMDENGCYDGWIEFTVAVVPDLSQAFGLEFSGISKDDDESHGDYIHDTFTEALSKEITPAELAAFYETHGI